MYQFNVPPVPVAVKLTAAPILIEAELGETIGAAGEVVTVIGVVSVVIEPAFVMATNPFVPKPANPVIEVAETTVNAVTGVPPIVTAVTPLRPVPVMVKVPEL